MQQRPLGRTGERVSALGFGCMGLVGWYVFGGRLDRAEEELARELDALHETFGKPIILAEFGTDTLPGAHSTTPEMWTEEYQVDYLRRYLDVAAQRLLR